MPSKLLFSRSFFISLILSFKKMQRSLASISSNSFSWVMQMASILCPESSMNSSRLSSWASCSLEALRSSQNFYVSLRALILFTMMQSYLERTTFLLSCWWSWFVYKILLELNNLATVEDSEEELLLFSLWFLCLNCSIASFSMSIIL